MQRRTVTNKLILVCITLTALGLHLPLTPLMHPYNSQYLLIHGAPAQRPLQAQALAL